MTLIEYARRHWTTLRYLSKVWGMPYLNLLRYSVCQQSGSNTQNNASARLPNESTRQRIHDLTQGMVDRDRDWPEIPRATYGSMQNTSQDPKRIGKPRRKLKRGQA